MPNDEMTEYLTTQAVADFLATEAKLPLDGIVFPSVQNNDDEGFNVVLFHKASTVQEIEVLKDANVKVSTGYETEDGWEDYYTVSVEKPTSTAVLEENEIEMVELDLDPFSIPREEDDTQETVTLRIYISSYRMFSLTCRPMFQLHSIFCHRLSPY